MDSYKYITTQTLNYDFPGNLNDPWPCLPYGYITDLIFDMDAYNYFMSIDAELCSVSDLDMTGDKTFSPISPGYIYLRSFDNNFYPIIKTRSYYGGHLYDPENRLCLIKLHNSGYSWDHTEPQGQVIIVDIVLDEYNTLLYCDLVSIVEIDSDIKINLCCEGSTSKRSDQIEVKCFSEDPLATILDSNILYNISDIFGYVNNQIYLYNNRSILVSCVINSNDKLQYNECWKLNSTDIDDHIICKNSIGDMIYIRNSIYTGLNYYNLNKMTVCRKLYSTKLSRIHLSNNIDFILLLMDNNSRLYNTDDDTMQNITLDSLYINSELRIVDSLAKNIIVTNYETGCYILLERHIHRKKAL